MDFCATCYLTLFACWTMAIGKPKGACLSLRLAVGAHDDVLTGIEQYSHPLLLASRIGHTFDEQLLWNKMIA
jgi:hypothetical protein